MSCNKWFYVRSGRSAVARPSVKISPMIGVPDFREPPSPPRRIASRREQERPHNCRLFATREIDSPYCLLRRERNYSADYIVGRYRSQYVPPLFPLVFSNAAARARPSFSLSCVTSNIVLHTGFRNVPLFSFAPLQHRKTRATSILITEIITRRSRIMFSVNRTPFLADSIKRFEDFFTRCSEWRARSRVGKRVLHKCKSSNESMEREESDRLNDYG